MAEGSLTLTAAKNNRGFVLQGIRPEGNRESKREERWRQGGTKKRKKAARYRY